MLESYLVAKTIHIKKDQTLTEDKVLSLLADVTEIPTQRPKKNQKEKYSGKKKRHTLKSELAIRVDLAKADENPNRLTITYCF